MSSNCAAPQNYDGIRRALIGASAILKGEEITVASLSRSCPWLMPASFITSLAVHLYVLFGIVFITPLPVLPLPEPVTVFDRDHMADIDLDPSAGKPVVNSEEAANRRRPKADAFWGRRDQVVENETKARSGDEFQASEPDQKKGRAAPKNPAQALSMADLALDSHPRGRWSIGESTEFEGVTSSDSFSNDYLPDVSQGTRTMLSTREYQFFSYIERIRRAVAKPWQEDVQRRIDALWTTGRPLNVGEDLVTKLAINLDTEGTVKEVSVIRSSGSRTIDHAGESVFRRVGLFPNPPKGIAGDNGTITLRWVFVLKVTSGIAHVNWDETSDASKERFIR